jgi:hypothetical protein
MSSARRAIAAPGPGWARTWPSPGPAPGPSTCRHARLPRAEAGARCGAARTALVAGGRRCATREATTAARARPATRVRALKRKRGVDSRHRSEKPASHTGGLRRARRRRGGPRCGSTARAQASRPSATSAAAATKPGRGRAAPAQGARAAALPAVCESRDARASGEAAQRPRVCTYWSPLSTRLALIVRRAGRCARRARAAAHRCCACQAGPAASYLPFVQGPILGPAPGCGNALRKQTAGVSAVLGCALVSLATATFASPPGRGACWVRGPGRRRGADLIEQQGWWSVSSEKPKETQKRDEGEGGGARCSTDEHALVLPSTKE